MSTHVHSPKLSGETRDLLSGQAFVRRQGSGAATSSTHSPQRQQARLQPLRLVIGVNESVTASAATEGYISILGAGLTQSVL